MMPNEAGSINSAMQTGITPFVRVPYQCDRSLVGMMLWEHRRSSEMYSALLMQGARYTVDDENGHLLPAQLVLEIPSLDCDSGVLLGRMSATTFRVRSERARDR